MLEARDLPKCDISDFLQHRIDTAVREEHVQRAKEQGLPPKQVSSACSSAVEVGCRSSFAFVARL